jgi:hypothetical protein
LLAGAGAFEEAGLAPVHSFLLMLSASRLVPTTVSLSFP